MLLSYVPLYMLLAILLLPGRSNVQEYRNFNWDRQFDGSLADLETDSRSGTSYILTTSASLHPGSCLFDHAWELHALDVDGNLLWSVLSDELGIAQGELVLELFPTEVHVVGDRGSRCCLDFDGNIKWAADVVILRDMPLDKERGSRFQLRTFDEIYGFSNDGKPCWKLDMKLNVRQVWSLLPQPDGSSIIASCLNWFDETPLYADVPQLFADTMVRFYRCSPHGELTELSRVWPDYPFQQVGCKFGNDTLAAFHVQRYSVWDDILPPKEIDAFTASVDILPDILGGETERITHDIGPGPIKQSAFASGELFLLTDRIWQLREDGSISVAMEFAASDFCIGSDGAVLAAATVVSEAEARTEFNADRTGSVIEVRFSESADSRPIVFRVGTGGEPGRRIRTAILESAILIAWQDYDEYSVRLGSIER